MASRSLICAFALLSGCIVGNDGDDECTGGKCDGDGDSCADPRYGNGVCDLQIECAAPDIDCFTTFDDDVAAAAWFSTFETQLAMEEGRPPRTFLTPADPRWARTRSLLDEGWEAFQNNRPVGALRERRPGLVLIEDPSPNAFVAPDLSGKTAGFTVMVQTGLFETGGSDDGGLGVMMHEFQHVIGLHLLGDMRDRVRKFYFAGANEPIGKFQADDPLARMYGEAWRSLADDVGHYRDLRLSALPMGGQLEAVLIAAVNQAGTGELPACLNARNGLATLAAQAKGTEDPLTGELVLPATVPALVDQAYVNLYNACLAAFPRDVIGVLAVMSSTTPAAIEAQLSAEDVVLVKGKHVLDGFAALVLDRRAKLRGLEIDLQQRWGKPWQGMRYFSNEEDADDVSVAVLRAAEIKPDAIGPFLASFLPADARVRCDDLLARRVVPPYGADLQDEHHSLCWRAHHARQVAEAGDRAAHVARPSFAPLPAPRRLPIPRPLRDRLAY